MRRMIAIISTCMFAAVFADQNPASAEGALAVGLPPDVAKHGIALGAQVSQATEKEARQKALAACLGYKGAPVAIKLCKVVATFHDQCVADAIDPQAGTPGFGWGIGPDQRTAEKQALAKCEATAGLGRRAACRVGFSECDGTARTAK